MAAKKRWPGRAHPQSIQLIVVQLFEASRLVFIRCKDTFQSFGQLGFSEWFVEVPSPLCSLIFRNSTHKQLQTFYGNQMGLNFGK
jgi:hypothetical protein